MERETMSMPVLAVAPLEQIQIGGNVPRTCERYLPKRITRARTGASTMLQAVNLAGC